MKKIKSLIIVIISTLAFNPIVFAASGNLSVNKSSVYVGDSFTVTANVNSAAAWNVHVSASGPVSGCTINQADATSDANDTNKSFSATCTATGEGTITVVLSGDVTSAADGNAVSISGSRSVTVTTKPAQPSNNNGGSNNGNNNNNSGNANDNRSKNNNIKELSVEGYDLIKVDANNYTLTVTNEVTSVNVKVTAEDAKAKVTGAGTREVKIGENNIEVIVTAENGSQNKINIKVTRKDGYYLEDLDNVLKNENIDDINIIIEQDTKLSAQDLEKIKNSKKVVKLNYYDSDKNLIYSWVVNGSKLSKTNDLLTTIETNSGNQKDILRLSNYADGLFAHLKQTENLPSGTRIRMFVGNKYENGDLVNIYSYNVNDSKLELVNNKLKVSDGYVEFDVTNSADYFITMTTINSNEQSTNIYMIIAIIEFVVLLVILVLDITKTNPIYRIKK